MPFLYSAFHANLMFSSISEEDRPEVIQRCYWPLLNLIERQQCPLAIELSALTLTIIQEIDPKWIAELNRLSELGLTEVVASGYSQLIAPLVPAEVNIANLEIGKRIYSELLRKPPSIAFFNEQAFSQSLIPIYKAAGYNTAVVEWENPYSRSQNWQSEWQYQIANTQFEGTHIDILWNHSTAFQKLQRYAHGEITLSDYSNFLQSRAQKVQANEAYCFYAGDLETFDYRPGRFADEQKHAAAESEWGRIETLVQQIQAEGFWQFKLPSQVVKESPHLTETLQLTTPEYPIVVKKQLKYNISRWAATGRDDCAINTRCHRLYKNLLAKSSQFDSELWQELCYLWSSDFRTHITAKRWSAYQTRLHQFEAQLAISPATVTPAPRAAQNQTGLRSASRTQNGHLHAYENDSFKLCLNQRRGLAIREWICKSVAPQPLIGTILHGELEHISLNNDFYSAHTLLETPGKAKSADLNLCQFSVTDTDEWLHFQSTQETALGTQEKNIRVFPQSDTLEVHYKIWPKAPIMGSLRLGYLTLRPDVFAPETSYFESHLGGLTPERFPLMQQEMDHAQNLNLLISSLSGFCPTNGTLVIGDHEKQLHIEVDTSKTLPLVMLTSKKIKDAWFCRLAFSLSEMDETRRSESTDTFEFNMRIRATRA